MRKRHVLILLVALAAIVLPPASAGTGGPKKLLDMDHGKPPFDVRTEAAPARRAPTAPQLELRESLGAGGVVDIDRLTGTARVVAKLGGFVNGPTGPRGDTAALDLRRGH